MDAYANFAYTTVATPPAPATSGTSLTVPAGTGARFPAPPFNAVVCEANAIPIVTNSEIVRVTAIVGDTLTIVRNQEVSIAFASSRAILAGDQCYAGLTKRFFDDLTGGGILPTPIGYWPFNEGGGTPTLDKSGNTRNWHLVNGAAFDVTNKKFGYSALRNNAAAKAAHLLAAWDLGTVHTIAFWLLNMTSGDGVVMGGANNFFSPYLVGGAGGAVYYSPGSGGVSVAHGGLAGTNHLCLVRNQQTVTVYKNGLVLGAPLTLGGNANQVVGSLFAYDADNAPLQATIDDLRVYGFAFTAAQVAELYSLAP